VQTLAEKLKEKIEKTTQEPALAGSSKHSVLTENERNENRQRQ